MKIQKTFPSNNHKDHFIYDNLPFLNPEDGELSAIEWATVIDISLLPDAEEPYYRESPNYYLQVTPHGEIRGVTHDYGHPSGYFYVASDDSEIRYLKKFVEHYPGTTPTLAGLLGFQNYVTQKLQEQQPE